MGTKMYMLIRDGEIFAAIFDVGSWYLLIIGLPLLYLGIFPGLYLTVAGALMLLLTQGRSAKNPVMKFLNGLLSLYGITGYLGDVLSYSRLLALGLATSVIAAVINTLATLNAPGIISGIAFLIIIAFGTAFNIAINALGAFVHTSRLQYVEFFSKFYDGGGEAFKPFKIKTKYINII
jgi:V/A-type H+-transporting ATPase subunit I